MGNQCYSPRNCFFEGFNKFCGLTNDNDIRPPLYPWVKIGEDRSKNHPHEWTDIAGTVTLKPSYLRIPEDKDQLIAAVQDAAALGLRVRVAGSGHSGSPLVRTNEFLILDDRLREILYIDPAAGVICCQGGVSANQMNLALRKHNLAIPQWTIYTEGHIAGVTATGCHGSGIKWRTIPDFIMSMDIVDAHGVMRRYNRPGFTPDSNIVGYIKDEAKDDPDVFFSVIISLGMFGVIYSITLRADPIYNVEVVDEKIPNTKVLDKKWLKNFVLNNEYVEFLWFPFNDTVWAHHHNPSSKMLTMCTFCGVSSSCCLCYYCCFCCLCPQRRTRCLALNDNLTKFNEAIATGIGKKVYAELPDHPEITETYCKVAYAAITEQTQVEPNVEAIHFRESYICEVKVRFTEVGFVVDDDFANVVDAWNLVLVKVDEYAKKGKYPMNVAAEMRFVSPSQALLSPGYLPEQDYKRSELKVPVPPGESNRKDNAPIICFIEISCAAGTKGYDEFAAEIGDMWLKLTHGRPHWGKDFTMIPDHISKTNAAFKACGDGMERFLKARDKLNVDPHGMFVNDWLNDMFFKPSGRTAWPQTGGPMGTTGGTGVRRNSISSRDPMPSPNQGPITSPSRTGRRPSHSANGNLPGEITI